MVESDQKSHTHTEGRSAYFDSPMQSLRFAFAKARVFVFDFTAFSTRTSVKSKYYCNLYNRRGYQRGGSMGFWRVANGFVGNQPYQPSVEL